MEPLSLLLNAPEPIYQPLPARPSLLRTLSRYRRIGATVFLTMMLLTVLSVFLFPRTYEAHMQFVVNNDRVNVPVGADNSTQAIVYMNDINEAQVNTEVSLLTSNDLLIDLVRKSGLAGTGASWDDNEQSALRKLKNNLAVTPLRKSAVIEVRYKSNSREGSVHVLSVLSALYLNAHARLHGTPGAFAVFEKLWEGTSLQRIKAESALNDFKREHNIVSLPEEKAIALQREADLEKQYADASVAAGKSSKQTQELERILAHTPTNIVGERRSIPNQGEIEHLGSVLSGLQLKRIEAASRYLPADRILTDLDLQIAETKAALEAASSQNAEEVSMISNPVLHEAQTEIVRVRGNYAGDQEEANQLRQKLGINRKRLLALDQQAAAYSTLNESVARFTELERLYRQKADTARTEESLNANHVSNVSLAETPFAPQERSPRVGAILAVGIAWSVISSLLAILLVDRTRARVTKPFDVERALGAPVIAVLCARSSIQDPIGYVPPVYARIVGPKRMWRLA